MNILVNSVNQLKELRTKSCFSFFSAGKFGSRGWVQARGGRKAQMDLWKIGRPLRRLRVGRIRGGRGDAGEGQAGVDAAHRARVRVQGVPVHQRDRGDQTGPAKRQRHRPDGHGGNWTHQGPNRHEHSQSPEWSTVVRISARADALHEGGPADGRQWSQVHDGDGLAGEEVDQRIPPGQKHYLFCRGHLEESGLFYFLEHSVGTTSWLGHFTD